MRSSGNAILAFLGGYATLVALHLPLLRLPYFWDEAGYYVPAAVDFYRAGSLIPTTTLPEGHPPLVMIYLGLAWRVFGFSPEVARAAMTLLAAATVAALYVLARRVAGREVAAWSAVLLAISPLFFAQSTLVLLDLATALFTTVAVLFLVGDRLWPFALAASLAVMTKETAVVLLPVAWVDAWRRGRAPGEKPRETVARWAALVTPALPLAAWTLYYHRATGYWTGNRGYLSYNVYSTLSPERILWSLLRRGDELFVGGFNGVLAAGAVAGFWWGRRKEARNSEPAVGREPVPSTFDFATPRSAVQAPGGASPGWTQLVFLTAGLAAIYLLLLSVVGGAVLPRYLLPVFPVCCLIAVAMVWRLPRLPARMILVAVALCFVCAWYINPPYPFPFEDNLAYADYVRLHEQAGHYLEMQPNRPRVLTAWPVTDELTQPFLGYVRNRVRVVPVQGFAPQDFANVAPGSFDLLYFYSRRWEPPGNWLARVPRWLRVQERYFDYHPQIAPKDLAAHFHLRLVARMEQRGQWVRIYSR